MKPENQKKPMLKKSKGYFHDIQKKPEPRVTKKEKLISVMLYLSLFTALEISFFALCYVHFFYGKTNKYLKFHSSEAGFIWILRAFLFIILIFSEPFKMGKSFTYIIPKNPITITFSTVLNILTFVMAIGAAKGKRFRPSKYFDVLRR